MCEIGIYLYNVKLFAFCAFTEARDSEWQWHLLGHMQVCTSLPTDRGVDLCKNVGAGEMKIINSAVRKQFLQRRYFCFIIGVRINVNSC